ncbi:hypothetical protein ACGFYQ_40120 [Streptomyces sp. NPDC048258]|uniref:hypothetical protein n=1 Tax=Streptomyces sp. NPDC048258 TaxID=3365527 RepID=UPI003719CF99
MLGLALVAAVEATAAGKPELFTSAPADCDPRRPARSRLLNNRGITWLYLGDREAAKADFTAVIEDGYAGDEGCTCALNNRADIHDDEDDATDAVADRTAVLGLAETTHNRRCIALGRRAPAYWKQGDTPAVVHDDPWGKVGA